MDILLVEDDRAVRITVRDALEEAAHHVLTCEDGPSALAAIAAQAFDLLISDVRLPGIEGLALLRELRRMQPGCDALLMTAYGKVEDAVTAIREGAHDYITKPFEIGELMLRVGRIGDTRRFRASMAAGSGTPATGDDDAWELIGDSAPMAEIRRRVAAAAESGVNVLITGETGTGKELCARALHQRSARRARPLIQVNCASFPAELFEAEMFGHERGAFTGAVRRREGRMLAADGGSLFLDEVGELALDHQAKLLRALDSQTFEPVGSSRPLKVDVRVIAATNRDLEQAVRQGTFRQDLLYRLRVLELEMPPLRQRRNDVPLLVGDFLARAAERSGQQVPELSPAVMAALICHDYPGNVRELYHALEHGLALARGGTIELQHLPPAFARGEQQAELDCQRLPLSAAVRQFELAYIKRVLEGVEGRRTEAARVLGISRKSLWQKLRDSAGRSNS